MPRTSLSSFHPGFHKNKICLHFHYNLVFLCGTLVHSDSRIPSTRRNKKFVSMEKNSVDYSPLLSPRGDETAIKTTSFLVSATKWTLKTLILVIFVLWTTFIFSLPAKPVNELFSKWNDLNRDTPFGVTGYLIIFPFVFFAFVFFFSLCMWCEFKANCFFLNFLQEAFFWSSLPQFS